MSGPAIRPSAYLVPVVVDAGGMVHTEVGVEVGASVDGGLPAETLSLAIVEALLVVAANLSAPIDPALADLIGSALDYLDGDALV